jgi:hypothetical protein
LEHTRPAPDEPDRGKWLQRLIELLTYELHRRQHQTKPQIAAALIEQMAISEMAPDVYTVDSALFAPVMIEAIENQGKPWLAVSREDAVGILAGADLQL